MPKKDLELNNLVIQESASLGEAMVAMTDNQRGAVCVVDGSYIFKGMVSDGDIRRALITGALQSTPLSKILNPNPRVLYAGEDPEKQAEILFLEYPEFTILPVIMAKSRKLCDVKVRDKKRRKIL